jgi:hypothetical protein
MVIVENQKQFSEFIAQFKKSDSIIIPVQLDESKHPSETELCILYVKIIDSTEYILPFNHSEALNLPLVNLYKLHSKMRKYTYNKKQLNQLVSLENVIDVNLQHYIMYNQPLEVEDITTQAHKYFNYKYYNVGNVNKIIPILKHLEYCRKLVDRLERYTTLPVHTSYNNDVIDVLSYIEKNGIYTINGMKYTEYNPYTSTGRPSNRFGGVNYAALNKKDGTREQFISRFGKDGVLVEMDYDAYHLRLIADVVGYDFPEGSVHEYLGAHYGVSYDESKVMSFKYLYGGIPNKIAKEIPFFGKVNDYIAQLWIDQKGSDFIKSYIYSKKIFKDNLTDMNKNKLFNYIIQNLETEQNMLTLSKLIPILDNYRSKLVLYNYDAFLFDVDLSDGSDFINNIRRIIEVSGKFPVKISRGINYNNMERIL